MKKSLKIILCFVSTSETQSYQYQYMFFEIRHIKTKYVNFLFRLNFDFDFFIKPWRNRLCIWTVPLKRVDLDCNFWGSPPFKLTTVGEVWWPLQLNTSSSNGFPVWHANYSRVLSVNGSRGVSVWYINCSRSVSVWCTNCTWGLSILYQAQ